MISKIFATFDMLLTTENNNIEVNLGFLKLLGMNFPPFGIPAQKGNSNFTDL